MKLYRLSNSPNDSDNVTKKYDVEDVDVFLHEFDVVKETKCGWWIVIGYEKRKRFVLSDTTKQYASPTIEDATKHFIARKNCQIRILTRQLDVAKKSVLALGGKLIDWSKVYRFVEDDYGY